jgi:hypothetical protein
LYVFETDMIKTLRITSVVAAIMAGIFFVFPVIYGVRSDESVDKFLQMQSVKEKFENAADIKAKKGDNRVSPLVEQADAFALYLNPVKQPVRTISKGVKTPNIASNINVTPKFKVFATSFYPENPKLSQALIDEPGKGRYWVRQSSMVGHLLVEQVKDGLVVVKGNEETFELKIEKEPSAGPLKSATGSLKTAPISSLNRRQSHLTPTKPPPARTATDFRRTANIPQKPQINADDEKVDELVNKLKDLQKSPNTLENNSELSKEEREKRDARIQELISKFKATRVSAEESKKLGNMGEELKGTKPALDEEKEDNAEETDISEPNESSGK